MNYGTGSRKANKTKERTYGVHAIPDKMVHPAVV